MALPPHLEPEKTDAPSFRVLGAMAIGLAFAIGHFALSWVCFGWMWEQTPILEHLIYLLAVPLGYLEGPPWGKLAIFALNAALWGVIVAFLADAYLRRRNRMRRRG